MDGAGGSAIRHLGRSLASAFSPSAPKATKSNDESIEINLMADQKSRSSVSSPRSNTEKRQPNNLKSFSYLNSNFLLDFAPLEQKARKTKRGLEMNEPIEIGQRFTTFHLLPLPSTA
jgi:hypothetical protein